MKKVIVVGSGAGGATAAKELQGNFEVTILEAGKAFHPFSFPLPSLFRARLPPGCPAAAGCEKRVP